MHSVTLTHAHTQTHTISHTQSCGSQAGREEYASYAGNINYGMLSHVASGCGFPASTVKTSAPAPDTAQTRLCADPAAFDPAAGHDYSCYAMITASFTEADCSAAGCYSGDGGGQRYCSCSVTGSDACLAKLPGKISRACVRACVRV